MPFCWSQPSLLHRVFSLVDPRNWLARLADLSARQIPPLTQTPRDIIETACRFVI
jgi:hypothetical protein